MINRPLVVASTGLAVSLLGAPSAMATTYTGGGSPCTGTLAADVRPIGVRVTGSVRCTADADLALRISASVGPLTVWSSSTVAANANATVAINATVPVPGCTSVSAVLVDILSGVTVAAAAG